MANLSLGEAQNRYLELAELIVESGKDGKLTKLVLDNAVRFLGMHGQNGANPVADKVEIAGAPGDEPRRHRASRPRGDATPTRGTRVER